MQITLLDVITAEIFDKFLKTINKQFYLYEKYNSC